MKQMIHTLIRVIRTRSYTLLLILTSLVFYVLFVGIPVLTTEGYNSVSLQLSIYRPQDFVTMGILALLMGLNITLIVYFMRNRKKQCNVSGSTAGGTAASASGILAGIASTAACSSCLAPLFALFGLGFGSVLFVLHYRWYFFAISLVVILASIILTTRNINRQCNDHTKIVT